MNSEIPSIEIHFRAFIPDHLWQGNPHWIDRNWFFEPGVFPHFPSPYLTRGDGRTFFEDGTSRLSSMVEFAKYDNRIELLLYLLEAGISSRKYVWAKDGVLTEVLSEKSASLGSAPDNYVQVNGNSTKEVSFIFKSEAAHAFDPTVSPDIDYFVEFSVKINKLNDLEICIERGTHDWFPAYEAFVRTGGGLIKLYSFDPALRGQSVPTLFNLNKSETISRICKTVRVRSDFNGCVIG